MSTGVGGMTISARWFDEEHTIILTEFIGSWTWDELWTAYRQILKMADTVDGKVDNIVDLTHSFPLPPPGALTQLRKVAEYQHPNTGITVYVKASLMMRGIATLFWKYFPDSAEKYPFEFAKTRAEAHARLKRYRDEGS